MPAAKRSSVLLAVATLIAAAFIPDAASGALLAVDFGGEHLTCVVVAPGSSPISVVTNEMSHRKSPAVLGFKTPTGERLLGEEAHVYGTRNPKSTIYFSRELLGSTPEAVSPLLERRGLAFPIGKDDERGTVSVELEHGTYSAEEMVGMILTYAKRIAESQLGHPVKDAVVTVPAYFGQAQRKGVMEAAHLAGLSPLGLVNDHLGAALQYGMDRWSELSKEGGEREVAIFDMGSGSSKAALVRFSSYQTKEGRVPQVETLAVDWEDAIGGWDFEMRLAEHFALEFFNKTGVDVRGNHRAMAKLRRQCRRTKEILSANRDAPLNVESLDGEERDFVSSLSRSEFDDLVSDLAEQAARPLSSVLSRSSDPSSAAIEIVGGATRSPIVQAKLQEAAGDSASLGGHMNADEAVAFGAGLYAANLSTIFRVRRFSASDALSFPVEVHAEGAEDHDYEERHGEQDDPPSGQASRHRIAFRQGHRLPSKRRIRVPEIGNDFSVDLAVPSRLARGKLPHGVPNDGLMSRHHVSGIPSARERHNSTGQVVLHLHADASGMVTVSRADLQVTFVEQVKVPVNKTNPNEAEAQAKNGTAQQGEDSNKTEAEEATAEAQKAPPEGNGTTSGNETSSNSGQQQSQATATEYEVHERKKHGRVQLEVETAWEAFPGLGNNGLTKAKERLNELDEVDRRKEKAARAKSNLEEFVYTWRDHLGPGGKYHEAAQEGERESLLEELSEAADWAEMEGADALAEEFEQRLSTLKANVSAVRMRLEEAEERPKVVKWARDLASGARDEALNEWPSSRPHLNESDRQSVADKASSFLEWLEDQERRQSERSLSDDPAFLSSDVKEKVMPLRELVAKLKARKPPPPPSPPSTPPSPPQPNIPQASPTEEQQPESEAEDGSVGEQAQEDSEESHGDEL